MNEYGSPTLIAYGTLSVLTLGGNAGLYLERNQTDCTAPPNDNPPSQHICTGGTTNAGARLASQGSSGTGIL